MLLALYYLLGRALFQRAPAATRRDVSVICAQFLTAFARDNYMEDNHFSRNYNRAHDDARLGSLRGVI